jgi:membrane protein DedA with SNARE-associated domain
LTSPGRPMSYLERFLNSLYSLPDLLVYILLGLSAYVENVFPPIPGDTITAFGAFLVGIGRLSFLGVYLSTTLGSLLGFLSLFALGGYLGRHFFVQRDYRFFRARDIAKAEQWFEQHGYLLIAMNRFLPGVRSAVSLAGGMAHLHPMRVGLLALLSCALWNLLWILGGYWLGSNWQTVEARLSTLMMRYSLVVLLLMGLVVFFLILRWRRKRGRTADR